MKYLFIICLCFLSSGLLSQNETSSEVYYKWFDSIIDISNTNLFNGVEFKEKYRTLENNNQYFLMQQFLPGYVVYAGQPYYKIPMKYDINTDNLIIKLKNKVSGQFAIQLIKDNVESFQIDGHRFINSNYLESDITASNKKGFYEVLFQSDDLLVLKKHIKNMQQRRNNRFEYSEFIYRSKFLINYQNKFSILNSKKSLIQLFPQQKNTINAFYNKNKPLIKSNYDAFLIKLMEHLNKLLNHS